MSDTRGKVSYPLEVAEPTSSARKSGAVGRYVQLFTKALAILTGRPLGTKVRVAEFSTDYGARNAVKGISSGETKIVDPPEGLVWNVEDYIEDVEVRDEQGNVINTVEVSRLYAWLERDEGQEVEVEAGSNAGE